jgi:hypothetical protein
MSVATLDTLLADPAYAELVAECSPGGRLDMAKLEAALYQQIVDLQGEIIEARQQLAGTPALPEGARRISAEEAAAWEFYQSLNMSPDELGEALAEADRLRAEAVRWEQDDTLKRHQFNPATLRPLLPAEAVVEEAEAAHGPGQIVQIRVGDSEPTPLGDWIEANLSAFNYEVFRLDAPALRLVDQASRSRGAPGRPDGLRHGRPSPPATDRDALDEIRQDLRSRGDFGGF